MSNVVAKRAVLPVAMALAIGMTGTARRRRSTGRRATTGSGGRKRADVIDAQAGNDRVGAGKGRTR